MPTLESIQARVTRLEDIKRIEHLQRIYGYYRDNAEWRKVVDLFSDNAESVEIADHGVYKGKAGVERFYIDLIQGGKDRAPRYGTLSIALQLQGVVTVDPDGVNAKGRWYGFMMEARPALSLHEGELRQTWGHGIYENEYVKEDGVWKFKKIRWHINFSAKAGTGFVKPERVAAIKPGSKLSGPEPNERDVRFSHAYPSGYIFPFHFDHPVTGEKTTEEKRNKNAKPLQL